MSNSRVWNSCSGMQWLSSSGYLKDQLIITCTNHRWPLEGQTAWNGDWTCKNMLTKLISLNISRGEQEVIAAEACILVSHIQLYQQCRWRNNKTTEPTLFRPASFSHKASCFSVSPWKTIPPFQLYIQCKASNFIVPSLTPDACALVGDVVLQFGPEPRLSSASHTPVVHQQEGLVVVVQAAGVPGRVLDVVLSRKAALQEEERRDIWYRRVSLTSQDTYVCFNMTVQEHSLLFPLNSDILCYVNHNEVLL